MKNKNTLFIFLHLPKSGGTTFNAHLVKHFKTGKEFFNLDSKENQEKFKNTIKKQSDQIKILAGHETYYGIHNLFSGREARYITFLRDPAERLVSQYNFDLRKSPINLSFERWYKSQIRNEMAFFYNKKVKGEPFIRIIYPPPLKFLLDKLKIENPPLKSIIKLTFFKSLTNKLNSLKRKTQSNEEELQNSKALLDKCWYIGITKDLDDDLKFLCREIGIPLDWRNKRVSPKKLTLDKNLRKKLYKDNPLDVELYEYAKKLNKEKKKKIFRK